MPTPPRRPRRFAGAPILPALLGFALASSALAQPIFSARADILRAAGPEYPADRLGAGTEGYVEVQILIGTDGLGRGARVLSSDPPLAFDAAVLQALPSWVFIPRLDAERCELRERAVRMVFWFEVVDGRGVIRVLGPAAIRASERRAIDREDGAVIDSRGRERVAVDGFAVMPPASFARRDLRGVVIARFQIQRDGATDGIETLFAWPPGELDDIVVSGLRATHFDRVADLPPAGACRSFRFVFRADEPARARPGAATRR